MQNRTAQPDIIIIGAGPAGLMTAIELKLRDPEKQILVLEKHQEYQRKHSVQLDRDAFQHAHPNNEFQELIRSLPSKIRINALENQFLEFAKKIGIDVSYQSITSCQQLAQDYPLTPIVIGADGSHSIVHKQIFDHEYHFYSDLQYMAEIKYEVSGSAQPLNTFGKIAATHFSHHYSSEFIGEAVSGVTPVAIRFFINQTTYEKMKEATFKNPYNLTQTDKIDPALLVTIKAWLIAREEMGNEKKIEGSERITTTHLPCYASKEFVKEKFDKTWFLVGDSAIGMPYFRGMGNAIEAAIQLAKAIHANNHNLSLDHDYTSKKQFWSSTQNTTTPLTSYTGYMEALASSEMNVAHIKNIGVQSLKGSAYVSQSMSSADSINLSSGTVHYKMRMREERQTTRPESSSSLFSMFNKSIAAHDGTNDKRRNDNRNDDTESDEKISTGCKIV